MQQVISIGGVSPDSVSGMGDKVNQNFDELYSGFLFTGSKRTTTGEVWFSVRNDGISGSGTYENPFNGATPELFDRNLSGNVDINTTIRLFPGHYLTQGYNGSTDEGVKVRHGQKFIGAGIDNTIIQLVSGDTIGDHYIVFGNSINDSISGVEISNLTIDCNSENQTEKYIACSAVSISSSDIKIDRCKAINVGTESFPIGNSIEATFFQINRSNVNNLTENIRIENCIAVQISENQSSVTSVFSVGGVIGANKKLLFTENAIIKNNYGNMQLRTGPAHPFKTDGNIYATGLTGTIKTLAPHNYFTGKWVRVQNVTTPSADRDKYNGYYEVVQVPDSTSFQYKLTGSPAGTPGQGSSSISNKIQLLSMSMVKHGVVENNIVMNADIGGPSQDSFFLDSLIVRNNYSQNIINGARYSLGSNFNSATLSSLDRAGTIATAAHSSYHNLRVGLPVVITNATPSAYNGTFVVLDTPDEYTFKYDIGSDPGSAAAGAKFAPKLYAGDYVLENNIFQMQAYKTNTRPIGFISQLTDNLLWPHPPHIARSIVIKDNIAGYVSGRQGEGFIGIALDISSADFFCAKNNIMSLDSTPTQTIRERYINGDGSTSRGLYLNNFNLSGQRITGRNLVTSTSVLDI